MRDGFSIQKTPHQKHRLKQFQNGAEIDRGLYDSHTLALEAIHIIIAPPPIAYFNKDGEPLHHEATSTERKLK